MEGKQSRWWRIRPGFLAGLAALAVICGAYDWYYHLPTGHGPAGPPVPEEAFDQPWRTGDVLLVGLGDSIVTGFGAAPGFGVFDLLVSNPEGDAPDMQGKNLRRVLPSLRVLNLAENSSSSGDHLRYQIGMLDLQPRTTRGIVVLSTGGIDLIHDYGAKPPLDEAVYGAGLEEGRRFAELFGGRLNRLLNQIALRFPGGHDVFVATIFDPTDGVGDIQNVEPILRLFKPLPAWRDGLKVHAAFNHQIRQAAAGRSNVHVVDVHRALLGHGLHCRDRSNPYYHPDDPTYWYFFNLEDPNRRGYDAIRRAFLMEMVRVLRPAPMVEGHEAFESETGSCSIDIEVGREGCTVAGYWTSRTRDGNRSHRRFQDMFGFEPLQCGWVGEICGSPRRCDCHGNRAREDDAPRELPLGAP